mmetsp:Transcript_23083/g.66272  ORF Transcript_23083/g.66272 Transcript_23083/m.66272 type:complete len:274 (+) Transcript_23083:71-892(+)
MEEGKAATRSFLLFLLPLFVVEHEHPILAHDLNAIHQGCLGYRFVFLTSQCHGQAKSVLDVAAIQSGTGCECIGIDGAVQKHFFHTRLGQEVLPDLPTSFAVQLFVMQRQRDTSLESGIQRIHAIRGQEHDSRKIFHKTKHDADHGIAFNRRVQRRTGLKEAIGFVQENDRIPTSNQGHHFAKACLQVSSGSSKSAQGQGVQRFMKVFCNGFGRQCLSATRRTVEQKDRAFAFPFHQIMKGIVTVADQSLDHGLALFWQNEAIEDIFLPFNLT